MATKQPAEIAAATVESGAEKAHLSNLVGATRSSDGHLAHGSR